MILLKTLMAKNRTVFPYKLAVLFLIIYLLNRIISQKKTETDKRGKEVCK